MAATAREYAMITVMAVVASVRLTGTTVASKTAAETTSRSTGTANRYTRSQREMVADGGSGSVGSGSRCNRQRPGGPPVLVARLVLLARRGASTRLQAACNPALRPQG